MSGVVNGTNYILLINGRYVMLLTGSSISFEHGTRDTSARETDNWSTAVLGMREFSIDCEGKYGFTYADGTLDSRQLNGSVPPTNIPALRLTDIIKLGYMQQQKLWLGFVDFTTGSPVWEGFVFLESVNVDTPMEDSSTISMSFKGKNEPNFTTTSNDHPPSGGNHY